MRLFLPAAVTSVVAGALLGPAVGVSSDDGPQKWLDAIRAKRWATAFLDTSNPSSVPAGVDRVVAVIAGEERVIYRASVMDRTFGWPVVSPDGTRVAFVKTDSLREELVTMAIDGSDLRVLFAVPVTGLNIRGARTSSPVAWSHDNRWLAWRGRMETDPRPATPPRGGPPESLWRIDASTGHATRLRHVEVRVVGEAVAGARVTAQAWAPDGRRLVYGNSDFNAIIHDTVTGGETDLGPGLDPTWSPDGRFIAARLPNAGDDRPGDYVVIDPEPPHRRTRLVSNASTLFSWGGPRYLGDPVWLPDSDGVFLYRFRRMTGTPYIVRRTTGEAVRMPFTSYMHSWGGRP
jgi:Tol biopolymer transport system component